jgi:1-acyl-sn-glycerol-3-phosphate acyltransferase
VLYPFARAVFPPVVKAIWRPKVTGLQYIPKQGGVLLAANHLSFFDSIVIPVLVPRRVVFLAKEDYFVQPGTLGAAQRIWMESMGAMPVDRDDPQAAVGSLEIAQQVLERGEVFVIYPEGTRSRDGRLYRGRTGVAHLALAAGVPVVPVGIQGTQNLQPVGASIPRLAKVTVTFGPPLDFTGQFEGVPGGKARRIATDQVMKAIAGLSGQMVCPDYNERPVG